MAKVFVGLSGGVDSAVSAALLKEAGHTVVGAFIKIWQPEFIECTWKEDRLDAMRVCAALDIPFQEVDLSEEYKREVIGDMTEGYRRGVTPNPDVLCNRHIKFGHFAKWAFENGAEKIATGHYARIEKYGHAMSLFRGRDKSKDQSYFLWQLTASDLETTLFPIGGLQKSDVRSKAVKLGLPVAKKPDSQGLCFVGDITMPEFLGRYIPLVCGDVLDVHGNRIGEHDGAALYTLGQRHGFRTTTKTGAGQPLYVISVDTAANAITVSSERARATRSEVRARGANIAMTHAGGKFRAEAQVRYREAPVHASIQVSGGEVHASFDEPRIAAPGQSLVLYDGDCLLGGGIIE